MSEMTDDLKLELNYMIRHIVDRVVGDSSPEFDFETFLASDELLDRFADLLSRIGVHVRELPPPWGTGGVCSDDVTKDEKTRDVVNPPG